MNRILRHASSAFLCAVLAGPVAAQQQPQQNAERLTIAFSDPERPGTLQMDLVIGTITIKGSNRKDVVIEAASRNGRAVRRRGAEPPPPGLHR